MRSTLFVSGVSGLLGLNAALQCRDRFTVAGCYLSHPVVAEGVDTFRLDVTDRDKVRDTLRQRRPDVVLHTVGFTNVDTCEVQPVLAARLNVESARCVAQAAREIGARLIHISTDHLFSGNKAMVNETAKPEPLNEYGRTKLQAEYAVSTIYPEALIIRTNFFGWGTSSRQSFSDWILQSLASGETLNMFSDVFFTPILVNDLVNTLIELLEREATGIFNVAGSTRLSKYNFGVQVARQFDYPIQSIRSISIQDAHFKIPRPRDMSLSTVKVAELLGHPLPLIDKSLVGLDELRRQNWPQMLESTLSGAETIAEPTSA